MASPIVQQNRVGRFNGQAVGDDLGEDDGFANGGGGFQDGPVAPEVAAKLAFEFWLKSVGPPRAVPRPEAFYRSVVEFLWKADVFTKEDLALCKDPANIGGNSPGSRDFIALAWSAAGGVFEAPPTPERVAVPFPRGRMGFSHFGTAAGSDPYSDEALEDRFLKMQFAMFEKLQGSKAVEAQPVFDLDAALVEIGLAGLSEECKPCSEAVEKLHIATEKLRKTKRVPFVNAKLAAFLPAHARGVGFKADEDDDDSETVKAMQKVMGIKKEKRNMSFLQCTQALDTYIVAGAATKQFEFTAGLAHVAIVRQVAGRAVDDGERHGVATGYDELVREKWANKAHAAGMKGTFDLNAAMREIDEKVYLKALSAAKPHKATAVEAPPAAGCNLESGKAAGKGRGDGKCNYCGKPGHYKIDCWQFKSDQSSGGADKLAAAVQEDAAGERKRQRHH